MARRYGARAGSAALMAGITLLIVSSAADRRDPPSSDSSSTSAGALEPQAVLVTGIGEHRRIALGGGAEVTLNTATTIRREPARDGVHEMNLETGEALFDNSRSSSAAIPIRVPVGGIGIETANALFSVRRDTRETYTLRVFAGHVTLSPYFSSNRAMASFRPVRLNAGRSAMIGPGAVMLSRFSEGDKARHLAWLRGLIVFDGEPLDRAVADINRYNEQKIRIDDPEIAKLRIGGIYSATNPEGFAHLLGFILRVQAEVVPSGDPAGSVIVLKAASQPVSPPTAARRP